MDIPQNDSRGCVIIGGAMVFHDGSRWFSHERFLNYLNELATIVGPIDFFSALCINDPTGIFSTPVPDSIKIHPIRFSSLPLQEKFLETVRLMPELYKAVRRRKAVVHFFPAALTPLNQLLLRRYSDAYISYYKSDWIAWTKNEAARQRWKVQYWAKMEELEASLADASVFRSDAHRRRLQPICHGLCEQAQPILSTFNATTGEIQPLNIGTDSTSNHLHLLFVGVLEPYKGLNELVEALAIVKADIGPTHQWTLHLVGAPQINSNKGDSKELGVAWLPDWLQKNILDNQLESHIEVHGYVDDSVRLRQIYEKADLFVLPSWTEGFPRVIDEAMSFGLPVVTTPVGGIPDVLVAEKDALFVAPQDTTGLAQALNRLLRSSEERERFAKASRESFRLRVQRSAAQQHADLIQEARKQSR